MYSAVFSEITLKGKNRRFFQDTLLRNIALDARIKGARVLVNSDDQAVRKKLTRTFGIDIASQSISVKLDLEEIKKVVLSRDFTGKSIRVNTKRNNKKFPMNSQRVNEMIGAGLVDAGATVNRTNPDQNIYIEILEDQVLVSFEKFKCPGGLPVGSSGKVLSLLSGGIDSPVSSWLLMKRGCTVDFLHLHSFAENKDVQDSKIMKIMKSLKEYHPPKMRLIVAPYSEFYKKSLSLNPRNELVVFRRFLLRLANDLAKEHKAIVTGDSLGQVASQTLDNINTTNEVSELPVFRPLISFNKQEIVDLSKEIGFYKTSIEPYKDCCSLVAHKSPSTKVKLPDAKKIEDEMNIEKVVEKTVELCDVIEI